MYYEHERCSEIEANYKGLNWSVLIDKIWEKVIF